MLENLTINNIVLIDKLHIDLSSGFCVLTGETGSGKSILLDALGLAIGYRSNSKLLRNGEAQGSVVAVFNIENNQKCKDLLKEQDILFEDNIIIRRIIYDDGRSKAFINDMQVTQSFLQNIGETLVEIHGQNEQIGLLNSSFHRDILDNFGGFIEKRNSLKEVFDKLKNSKNKLEELNNKKLEYEKEQDYLRHVIGEINSLDLHENEEQELEEKKSFMSNREKIINILNTAKNSIDGDESVTENISGAINILSRNSHLYEGIADGSKNEFTNIIDKLDQANALVNEVKESIDAIFDNLDFDGETLESVEERLFMIKSLARKLQTQPNLLLKTKEELEEKLYFIENQEVVLGDLEKEVKELRENYLNLANELSKLRKDAAKKLSTELTNELIPLKMEKTIFDVEFKELAEDDWNQYGIDSVRFIASTNPGIPMGELSKIASGGELSRFMLALRVVLLKVNSVPTMVFDEIDTGVGGEVANAIGDRLKKLGNILQVLVVTHLAQVASKANYHLKVQKIQENDKTKTLVNVLNDDDRVREIARMFSGDNITDEILNVAKKMISKNE